MQLKILVVIVAVLPIVAAWSKWLSADRKSLSNGRRTVFLAGLLALSVTLIGYCLFTLHAYRIGGFGTDFPAMLTWARVGTWVSVLALVCILIGRGKSRLLGVLSSVLMLILWIIPIWGM